MQLKKCFLSLFFLILTMHHGESQTTEKVEISVSPERLNLFEEFVGQIELYVNHKKSELVDARKVYRNGSIHAYGFFPESSTHIFPQTCLTILKEQSPSANSGMVIHRYLYCDTLNPNKRLYVVTLNQDTRMVNVPEAVYEEAAKKFRDKHPELFDVK